MSSHSFVPQRAARIDRLTGSVARDILSRARDRSIVSFAGGLPDPAIWEGIDWRCDARPFLQYGPSEGDAPLRRLFAERIAGSGMAVGPEQILVTTGSQQGIDLCCKLLVEPGTPIAVESPTYLAALQCLHLFGARIHSLNSDENGLNIPALAALLQNEKPAALYLNPTFQNPSGRCCSDAERTQIAALLDRSQTVLIEDDPYRNLYYGSLPPPAPIAARLRRAAYVYLTSASKILAPGLRVGALAASPSLLPDLLKLKQAADLHTDRLAQSIVVQQTANAAEFAARLDRAREHYRVKRDGMAELLAQRFSGIAEWSIPEGGMFFWLRLRAGNQLDLRRVLEQAIEQGFAFMPGHPFFASPSEGAAWVRLNFTAPSVGQMAACLPKLAQLLES